MSTEPSPAGTKIAVLLEVERVVRDLISAHEAQRVLWWPSELLPPPADGEGELAELRERARGITAPLRAALALNLLTEEGLPHFHRILSSHLLAGTSWALWRNLWTAEEDRHGTVLRDYVRHALVLDTLTLERLQFEYIRTGHEVAWDADPYRVFVYTALQERATQISHATTGRMAGRWEPTLERILKHIAAEEARHYGFYRAVFKEILDRDPDQALQSAACIVPALEMPGVNIPQFAEFAEVARRAGIFGPRQYQKIVEEQIHYWNIAGRKGLSPEGARAQERILDTPARLERLAERLETRSRPRTFCFEVAHGCGFQMD